MDTIFINDLIVSTLIGVDETERRQPQEVVVNITLTLDLWPASQSDDLADTIDYREIANRVRSDAVGKEFYLVESLAEMIAGICLEYERVDTVIVSVEKVAAMEHVGRVGVVITRMR